MPRRRLFLVVAAGVLALAALAGCRVEPGNAAFVGSTTFSKADLDRIVDQYKRDGGKVEAADEVGIRGEITRDQVFVEVAARYAREQKFGDPTIDFEQYAQQSGLPANDPALRLLATVEGYRTLLMGHVAPVEPTEAELHGVYDYLVSKQVNVGSYEETVPQLRQIEGFGAAIGVRRALSDAVHRYQVQVNPLYDAQFVLFTVQGQSSSIPVVTLDLAGGGPAPGVTDLPHA